MRSSLPVWPLPWVAAMSLVGASTCFALGLRDLLQGLTRKASKEDRRLPR
ncbi:MAG: hypothetical protein ACREPI_12115 [Candidatus Dormibacterales bacterium]